MQSDPSNNNRKNVSKGSDRFTYIPNNPQQPQLNKISPDMIKLNTQSQSNAPPPPQKPQQTTKKPVIIISKDNKPLNLQITPNASVPEARTSSADVSPSQSIHTNVPRAKSTGIKIEPATIKPSKQAPAKQDITLPKSSSGDLKVALDVRPKTPTITITKGSSNTSLSSEVESEICPFCEKFSFPYKDLMMHILKSHNFVDQLVLQYKSSKSPLPACSKCDQTFTKVEVFVQHMVSDHEKDVLVYLRDNFKNNFSNQENAICDFIEKHAPNLNPRLERTFMISSSDDEEPEAIDAPIDEDYVSFVASTIKAEGIATRQPKRSSSFQPTNVVVKKEDDGLNMPRNAVSLLAELSNYEMFLRNENMISIDNYSCLCCICQKRFDTSIRLIEHCFNMHKLRLDPELRLTLAFMSSKVTESTPKEELMRMPELRIGLLLYPKLRKPDSISPTKLLNIPMPFANFLIECFSKPDHKVIVNPVPTVMMFHIPAPVPILVHNIENNKTQLGFADTSLISAEETCSLIKEILKNFAGIDILRAEFRGMNLVGFTEDQIDDIADKYSIALIKSDDVIDEETSTRSFMIEIMNPYQWTEEKINQLNNDLNKMYDKGKTVACRKCRIVYDPTLGGECTQKKIGGMTIELKNQQHEIGEEFSHCQYSKCQILA